MKCTTRQADSNRRMRAKRFIARAVSTALPLEFSREPGMPVTMREIDRYRQAIALLREALQAGVPNRAMRRQMERNIASYRDIVEELLPQWWAQGFKEAQ